jgi:hypothetical protein
MFFNDLQREIFLQRLNVTRLMRGRQPNWLSTPSLARTECGYACQESEPSNPEATI